MPTVELLGQSLEITPPRRRIYVVEVSAELQSRPVRAFAAALGLGCRGLWATRTEPKYDGRAALYGEDVFEILASAGADSEAITMAGIEVWRHWIGATPSAEAVKEARDFTPADAAVSTASVGGSSDTSG
jgi:hypothetical protein